MLKKYSGMAIKYFKFTTHLKYIFKGKESITRPKVINATNLIGPYVSYISFNQVFARMNGVMNK